MKMVFLQKEMDKLQLRIDFDQTSCQLPFSNRKVISFRHIRGVIRLHAHGKNS